MKHLVSSPQNLNETNSFYNIYSFYLSNLPVISGLNDQKKEEM
jgi:hypothetical protein